MTQLISRRCLEQRKGMDHAQFLVVMVLSLLVASTFLLATESVFDDSIEPGLANVQDQIDEMASTRTATIGAENDLLDSNQEMATAERQMEGLIVWNMAAASNCNLLADIHMMSNQIEMGTVVDTDEDLSEDNVYGPEEEIPEDVREELAEETVAPTDKHYHDGGDSLIHEDYVIDDGEGVFEDPWVATGLPDAGDEREGYADLSATEPVLLQDADRSIDEVGQYGYIGRFDSFLPLIASGFDEECVGAPSFVNEVERRTNQIVQEAVDAMAEQMEESLSFVDTIGSVVSGVVLVSGSGITLGGCGITTLVGSPGAGAVCTTAGGAATLGAADRTASYISTPEGSPIDLGTSEGIQYQAGFDMEGRQGRTQFEVETSFMMGESVESGLPRENQQETMEVLNSPLLGLSIDLGENYSAAPGFWRAGRYSYLLPSGLEPLQHREFEENQQHQRFIRSDRKMYSRINPGEFIIKNSFWDDEESVASDFGLDPLQGTGADELDEIEPEDVSHQEARRAQELATNWLYAFRPRMVNVPIISDEKLSSDKLRLEGHSEADDAAINELRNFLANTEYVICEGAAGQVQSNSGVMDEEGETSVGRAEVDGQVYPEVEIWSNATECLTKSVGSGIFEEEEFEDGIDLACDRPGDVLGDDSMYLFERETKDGDTHTAEAVCGVQRDNTDIAHYRKDLGYYYLKPALDGCTPQDYRIGDNQIISQGDSWFYELPLGTSYDGPLVTDQEETFDYFGPENVELAYSDRDEKHVFKLDFQTFRSSFENIPERTEEFEAWVKEEGGSEFRLVVINGQDQILDKTVDSGVEAIEGNKTIEVDAAEENIVFNRDREHSGRAVDFSPDEDFYAEQLNGIEISLKSLGDFEDVVEEDIGEEEAGSVDILFVNGRGEPEVCRDEWRY